MQTSILHGVTRSRTCCFQAGRLQLPRSSSSADSSPSAWRQSRCLSRFPLLCAGNNSPLPTFSEDRSIGQRKRYLRMKLSGTGSDSSECRRSVVLVCQGCGLMIVQTTAQPPLPRPPLSPHGPQPAHATPGPLPARKPGDLPSFKPWSRKAESAAKRARADLFSDRNPRPSLRTH